MSDYIKRQDAIDAILKIPDSNWTSEHYANAIKKIPSAEAFHMAIEALEKTAWIPVSERLPEDNTDILATVSNDEEVRIAPVSYYKGVWYDAVFNNIALDVIAWMPLPEPYKESDTE